MYRLYATIIDQLKAHLHSVVRRIGAHN